MESPEGKSSGELYEKAGEIRESAERFLKTGIAAGIGREILEYDDAVMETLNYANQVPELYGSAEPVLNTALTGLAVTGVGIGGIKMYLSKNRENQAAERENTENIVEELEEN